MAHLIDTVQCKRHFYMHWETKKFMWLSILWCSLYCSRLEPNSQHLWGMPIVHCKSHYPKVLSHICNGTFKWDYSYLGLGCDPQENWYLLSNLRAHSQGRTNSFVAFDWPTNSRLRQRLESTNRWDLKEWISLERVTPWVPWVRAKPRISSCNGIPYGAAYVYSRAKVLNQGWSAMSEDIFGSFSSVWNGEAHGIKWVEVRDVAKHPTMYKTDPCNKELSTVPRLRNPKAWGTPWAGVWHVPKISERWENSWLCCCRATRGCSIATDPYIWLHGQRMQVCPPWTRCGPKKGVPAWDCFRSCPRGSPRGVRWGHLTPHQRRALEGTPRCMGRGE